MTTGYTSIIEDGCSFAEYVWRCARAMGANIRMRDDSLDTPVREYEVDPHHQEQAEAAAKLVAELESMPERVCLCGHGEGAHGFQGRWCSGRGPWPFASCPCTRFEEQRVDRYAMDKSPEPQRPGGEE